MYGMMHKISSMLPWLINFCWLLGWGATRPEGKRTATTLTPSLYIHMRATMPGIYVTGSLFEDSCILLHRRIMFEIC